MPLNPVLFCPTVFAVGPKDEDKISLLANRVRSFRDEVKLMVKKFNDEQEKSKAGAAINAVYDPSTEDLSFEGEDVGGDCYHLTYQGQEKIAKALTGSIK